ncbi:MAG: hypothetical protein ACFFBV_11785, partial [Promethearchaeota archaeon]
YYLISGKQKPQSNLTTEQQVPAQVIQEEEPIVPIQTSEQIVRPEVAYCSECGNRFTDSMLQTLSNIGIAYCVHCGHKKTQEHQMSIESQ